MATVAELKYFGDPQENFKILKPWWDVFAEYLTILMLTISVLGISLQMSSTSKLVCIPVPLGLDIKTLKWNRTILEAFDAQQENVRFFLDRLQYIMVEQWCYDVATEWYSKYFPFLVLLHTLLFMVCANFWFKFPGTSSKIEHFVAVLYKCLDSPWTTKALSETVYEESDQKYLQSIASKRQDQSLMDTLSSTPVFFPLSRKTPRSKLSVLESGLPLENCLQTQNADEVSGNQPFSILDKKEAEQAKALFETVKKFRIHTEDGDILYTMYIRQTIIRCFQTLCILSYISVLIPRMHYIIHCIDSSKSTGFTDFFCINGLLNMFKMFSFAYIAIIILYSCTCLYTLHWIFFCKLKEYSFEKVREETAISDIPDVKNDFAFLLHLIDQYDMLYAKNFAIFLSDVSESKLLQINLNYEWTEDKLLQRTVINNNNRSELHLFMLPGIPSMVYNLSNLQVLKLELISDANIEPPISNLILLTEMWILNSIVKIGSKAHQFLRETLQTVHIRFENPEEIPSWVYSLKNLRELFFEGKLQLDSKTVIVLQSFRDLENLRTLHFQSNLTKVPIAIIDIAKNLSCLSIHNQGIKLVSLNNIKKLYSLNHLKLIHCGLDRIPSAVFSLSNLKELDITENKLTGINEVASFQNLTQFTSLKLHNNTISVISDYIAKVTSLESLDLSKNWITDLPPSLFRLTRLRYLSLAYNHISVLPREIGDLKDLETFMIEHNKISELPEELFACTKLRVLGLAQNWISSIPPEIGNLTQLRHLELLENRLNNLPPEIGNCSFLQKSQIFVEEDVYNTLPQTNRDMLQTQTSSEA